LKIGIISVGPGNIMNLYRGIKRAVESYQNITIELVDRENELYDLLFIPGVGNFGESIRRLRQSKLIGFVRKHYEDGRKIVGVCLGMQLLFSRSEEAPEAEGLSLIEGEIIRLKSRRVPHMGWNEVAFKDTYPSGYYYFVHSFRALCNEVHVLATTEYDGEIFPSAVRKDNVLGFQFHPEKSSKIGKRLIQKVVECALYPQ